MSYIRWFQEIDAGEVELVGGKGANLGEMARAGFPVPPGFCLTATAYRDFVQESGLNQKIGEILAEMDVASPADVESKSAQIRELFADTRPPATMAGQIVSAYRRLAQELGIPESAGAPVAVRSSATAEDLPDASFAGQQDTYLNVCGEEALLEHVGRCWASLWTNRAVSYRTRQGFDHQQVYLSVVVQAMIDSEISGILFTANPVNGNREEAVINASWGLGEAVVSGQVTPDTVTVAKEDGRMVDYQDGAKEMMIIYGPDGGTLEVETGEEQRTARALSDEAAANLAALGRQVEEHYGSPQDIEWGYANGKSYLLQARPITTLPDFAEVEGEYNRTMFIEIFPDPLTPVFLSVIRPLFKSMLDFTFGTLGFKPPEDINAVGVFYNQPYLNRRYIEQTLMPLSPAVREPLVAQIVNPFGHHEARAKTDLSIPYLRMMIRTLQFMVRFPKQLPGLLEVYREKVAQISALPVEGTSDTEIVAQIERLVYEAASELLDYDFLMIAVIGRTYRLLGSLLERAYGTDTDEVVARLISGVTGNVTMETNKRIWDLSRAAKDSPVVREALETLPYDELREHLELTAEGRDFLEKLDQFLATYGHREIRLDIIYPTWVEDPEPLIGFVRSSMDSGEEQSPYHQQERLVREREELTEEALDRVRQSVAGRLVVAPILRWILNTTQVHTRERDTMHFEWTRLFPPLRRLMLELGRRWRDQDLFEREEDIFFIGLDEMVEMAASPRSFKEEVRDRRQAFETNKNRPWPNIVRDGHEIYPEALILEKAEDGALPGVAGSPGVVSGIARVIKGPEEFDKLGKGDILVAPLTNPVWTPLFAVAGGIVTEVGGILSHGAIVAREYGIPAVMSVPGATARVPEGQLVTVDGNSGLVRVEGAAT